ncbi:MAG: AzlD domain-containing protein [Methylocystaceae bacterium]
MRLEYLWVVLGMGLATFATRFGSLALLKRTGIPPWLERWLEYVPTGILTALIVPALLIRQGRLELNFNNYYLLAGIIAGLIAYKSRNALFTMGGGMLTILLFRYFMA